MDQAFEVGEDGHPRFRLNTRHQRLAASRHDHVDGAIEPAEHGTDGGAVSRRHKRDRGLRQIGCTQALDKTGVDRATRMEAFRPPAQYAGIAGLEAKPTRIGRDVRAAFVDHADHPKGCGNPLDVEAVRTLETCERAADRVWQPRDGFEACGDCLDAVRVELQPIEHGRCQAPPHALRHVARVRFGNMLRARTNGSGGRYQGTASPTVGRGSQHTLRGPRGTAQLGHQGVDAPCCIVDEGQPIHDVPFTALLSERMRLVHREPALVGYSTRSNRCRTSSAGKESKCHHSIGIG